MRYSMGIWARAIRTFSLTASITPVLLGTALALYMKDAFSLPLMLAAVFGGLLLHAATNLISDYYDFVKGVDREETFGGSRLLVNREMKPRHMLWASYIAFGLATLIGVYLLIVRGWPIVAFGITGILGGYFYTAGPIGFKYKALGEFLVFALMGPLMVWGGYFVQTGELSLMPLWVSLPVGFLVAAILFANNLRDIQDDQTSGYNTQASLMGHRAGRLVYGGMLFSAYAALIALVILKQAPLFAALVILTIPAALKVNKVIMQSLNQERKSWAMVDVMTAQLHFQFGILFTISYVLGYFFPQLHNWLNW